MDSKLKILIFVILSLLFGCSKIKKNDNQLIINSYNDFIIGYSNQSKLDTINHIKFSIKNLSDDKFFILPSSNPQSFGVFGVYKDNFILSIYDENDLLIKPINDKPYYTNHSDLFRNYYDFLLDFSDTLSNRLKYKNTLDYFKKYDWEFKRLIIYSNEEHFFEYPINLNQYDPFDSNRDGLINLDKKNNYYCKLILVCDSTNYKKKLPRDILKTLETNNIKVYHGIIESTTKIPIKIIDN